MGIKGLSEGVIKQVWRDAKLADLPAGTRVGVDAAGWLHKAVITNAADICLEKGTHSAEASIAAAWREVGDAAEAGKAEAAQTSLTTCNVPSGDRGLD